MDVSLALQLLIPPSLQDLLRARHNHVNTLTILACGAVVRVADARQALQDFASEYVTSASIIGNIY